MAGLLGLTLMAASAIAREGMQPIDRSKAERTAIRDHLVGILTGDPTGVYAALGADLLRLFDDRRNGSMRLAVLMGSGSINNLDDLRNLPGASLAILQGDVMAAYAANPAQFQALRDNLRYVSRLHTEVLHVVTRKDIISRGGSTICALRGTTLNIGGSGSGARITVEKVFNDILGLDVTLRDGTLSEAFDQLENGKVAAFAYVVGRSARTFRDDTLPQRFSQANLGWLDVPLALLDKGCEGVPLHRAGDAAPYEGATLTSADYPALIPAGRTVRTIGVPAVLAAYRLGDPSRAAATAAFVKQFFQRAAEPRSALGHRGSGYSPNWCGVDVATPVGTWTRDETAAAWLDANERSEHPARTRIECQPEEDRTPSYCLSRQDSYKEFSQQIRPVENPTTSIEPDPFDFAQWFRHHCHRL